MRNINTPIFIFQDPENFLEYYEGHVSYALITRYRVYIPYFDIELTFSKNDKCCNTSFWKICDQSDELLQKIANYQQKENELLNLIRHSTAIKEELAQVICKEVVIQGSSRHFVNDEEFEIRGDDFYLF